MKTNITIFTILFVLILCACQKEKPAQKELKITDFTITPAGTVAQVSVTVTYPGKLTATLKVSQSEDMSEATTFVLEKESTEEETFTFNFTVCDLLKVTNYWCQIEVGNVFLNKKTDVVSFTTSDKDLVVTTAEVTDIVSCSASSGGTITADEGFCIVSRGVCWSTHQSPTINDSKSIDGQGTGDYNSRISNLIPNTTYYVRAYAVNGDLVFYGNEVNFTTIETLTFTANGVSFEMILVEGGTFWMGAQSTDPSGQNYDSEAYDNEHPVHQVTLSSYHIGKFEVAQELWQAVMGSNPSYFTGDSQRPVERVSWNDCQTFITALNELCASQLNGKHFSLPTEAQWEFAAKGGNQSHGYKYSGSNTIGNVAWYMDNSNNTTHAVGTKLPNELGIYDMSGNVEEWCQDWWGDYSSSTQTNPTGPSSGSWRVSRDGSWGGDARNCRVSRRDSYDPSITNRYLGLRLMLH